MRKRIVRRRRPLALAALLLTSVAVAATALLLGGGTAAAQEGGLCFPSESQAAHRLQLNTVTLTPTSTDPLAKTVAMEKDIFKCTGPSAAFSGVRDLETFIEIVERSATPSTPTMVTVDRRVEVAACDKMLATGVKCVTKTVPLGGPVANPLTTLDDCGPANGFPPDVQMNTVAVGTNQVKTIKVDKEVFSCEGGTQFLDVYLFTEILERLTSAQDNIKPYAKVFEGIACSRDLEGVAPTVTTCNRFLTS